MQITLDMSAMCLTDHDMLVAGPFLLIYTLSAFQSYTLSIFKCVQRPPFYKRTMFTHI